MEHGRRDMGLILSMELFSWCQYWLVKLLIMLPGVKCVSNVSQESLRTRILNCNTSHEESCNQLYQILWVNGKGCRHTILLFQRSVELYHLKYTLYVGDADSSSFKVVRETMEKTQGDNYCIEKQDCIGHIQKWGWAAI